MLTEKVPRLSRRKTLILFVLLLAFVLQAGAANAQEGYRKLTLKIHRIEDAAGRTVGAGRAIIGRKDGEGTPKVADFKEGKLEYERTYLLGTEYEVKLEAKDPEGKGLEAVVPLTAA